MSKSSRSLFVFGIYLVILGIILVVAPNLLLEMFLIPGTTEVWIRVVGMLLVALSIYYIQAARKEMIDFLRWSVYVRSSVIVFFTAFVLMDFASPTLLLFGVIDLLGALWTGLALRSAGTRL